MPSRSRRMVHYSGRVQGVGFRYCARELATGYVVSGYVRNLPDGRVELVAEGADDEINAFIAEVDARMERNIKLAEHQRLPYTGEFEGFEIHF